MASVSQIIAAVAPTLPVRTRRSSLRSAEATSADAHRVSVCLCAWCVLWCVLFSLSVNFVFAYTLQVTAASPKLTAKISPPATERRLPARVYTMV